jgi:hypothetical protein
MRSIGGGSSVALSVSAAEEEAGIADSQRNVGGLRLFEVSSLVFCAGGGVLDLGDECEVELFWPLRDVNIEDRSWSLPVRSLRTKGKLPVFGHWTILNL